MLSRIGIVLLMLLTSLQAMDIIELEKQCRIPPKEPKTYSFRLQDAETRQVRLHLEARFDWETLFGYTHGLRLTVNGQGVTGNRLLNKPLAYKTRSGGGSQWAPVDGNVYNIMYSPDFSDQIKTDASFKYGLYEDDQEPYRFVFDLSGLTQHVGSNQIGIETIFAAVIFRNIRIEIDENRQPRINDPAHLIKPAPEGEVPDYQLQSPPEVNLALQVNDKAIPEILEGARSYPLYSRFSLPEGKWLETGKLPWPMGTFKKNSSTEQTWETPHYRLRRRIEVRDTCLKVYDSFTNKRDSITGIAMENRLQLPEKPQKVLRGGLDSRLEEMRCSTHPSIIAEMQTGCIGIFAEDDVLRCQAYYRSDEDGIILGNRSFGLAPRASYTLEWSIHIVPGGKYYDLINQVRRDWNCNFTLPGVLAFPYMGGGKALQRWMKKDVGEKEVLEFLQERPVRMLMTHVASDITVPASKATPEKPFLGHGTAILHFKWWGNMTGNMIRAFKKTAPEIPIYAYMHKNLCSEFGHQNKYQDSEAIDPESRTLSAKSKIYGRYLPTPNNSYGRELAKVYRYLVDDLDAHIYMDEICLSVTEWAPYSEWDQHTVELDPETHEVKQALSIPNLLTKPWLEDLIAFLKSRDKKLMANGPPATRTLLNHHYPHFVEHGMGEVGLINAHLATPLGWSYDRGLKGFEHFRHNLGFGALAMTWSGPWTLDCFPFTPIELRPGYLIGEERIVTNLSGIFGWHDASEAEVKVYDGQGQLLESPLVKHLTSDGISRYEIRMPSDHVAILIRK
ncbi:MAG: hypothetical protein GX927_07095 [Lentisphaerae bacterium]|jgi:hypothetical protein|nr:hypothetical protein [Lentisphaerota bacterium]